MEIAVVGIACRYPGANSAVELYENILAGRRYFREMPPQRWLLEDYYHPDRSQPDKTYCKHGALLEGFEFNPSAFRIPQSTYKATDIAQWLALTVAKEALENADIVDPPRGQTAVILGNTLAGETSRANLVRYRWPYARRVFVELLDSLGVVGKDREHVLSMVEERYKRPFPPVNEDNLAGGLANTIAGRICNYFDFQGGGYTVDGACSSSLLAIQEACIGLQQHLCDLVLAGGIDISLDPFELVGFAKVGALTDSDIRVYDQRASGFLPGEGCGIVVLKRLEDAVRDGNRIYGIVRGVGYSSDGRGGITAPSVAGQTLAVDRAYYMAGYSFADVELIEGHGTGTPVGDKVELQTFFEAKMRHGATAEHRCGIGSIKSIIGHTKAAAGVAGFIKAVLSVYHQVQPPTMGLAVPNELFKSTSHVYPLVRGRQWKGAKGNRAAVSSAGFGGINTHITVERHDGTDADTASRINADYLLQSFQNAELFILTADNVADLTAKVAELLPVAKRLCHAELVDLAAYCAQNASTRPLRIAVVADTPYALHEKLGQVLAHLANKPSSPGDIDLVRARDGIFVRRTRRAPRVAFLYPGQGSQYLDMSRRWRDRHPFIRTHWQNCDDALEDLLSHRLSDDIFHDDYWAEPKKWDTWNSTLRATNIAQPAIVAASMATTEVLHYLGVDPDVVIGHSLGEYTALWSAGIITKLDALRLAAFRGAAMHNASAAPGGMLSINESPEKAQALCAGIAGYLTIANYNAPTQTVISGDLRAIDALQARCFERSVSATRLDVSDAFHSKLMEPAQELLRDALRGTRFESPTRLMISTVTGEVIDKAQSLPEHLCRQIVLPVKFDAAVRTAVREQAEVFIEIGPGSALFGLTQRVLGESGPPVFLTDGGTQADWSGWLHALGYLYASGLPVMPQRLFENRFFRTFRLPYEPKFIGSPCETPVEPLSLHIENGITLDFGMPEAPAVHSRAAVSSVPAETAESAWTADRLFLQMQRFIRERFGYPEELIHRATLLKDDLNLDSIKAAEVVAEAMESVRVRAELSPFYPLPLGVIAERIVGLHHQQATGVPGAKEPTVDSTTPWVRVFETTMVPETLRESQRLLTAGCVLLVASSGDSVAEPLREELETCGFTVERVAFEQLDSARAVALRGCIFLAPTREGEADIEDMAESDVEASLWGLPGQLLETAKNFLRHVGHLPGAGGDAVSASPPFFAVLMRSGTQLGHGSSPAHWKQEPACSAFMKSWSLENPGIEIRVLDFEPAVDPNIIGGLLLDELERGGDFVEAAYTTTGQRMVPRLRPLLRHQMQPAAALETASDNVLLVTGGAKGITAECVKALCSRRRMKVALMGSAAPDGSSKAEIASTLDTLARLRIEARYYQCDVTDAALVRENVTRIAQELGPIVAVIHGAGVNVPHRVEGLSSEAFKAVLRPKMSGLVNLIRALDRNALRELTVFSSIIGVSGMPGNSDYAYANAWASSLVGRLRAKYPRIHCRAFAYSIWQDVGMGARLGSVAALKQKGIDAIPRDEGVQRFVDLMSLEWRTPELVVMAQARGLPTLRFADVEVPPGRFTETILSYQPGVECVAEVVLHPDRDTYLADHDFNGALLFPAVMGMEAMAQVALKCARVYMDDTQAPSLEKLTFVRPIVVPPQGRAVRIHARIDEHPVDGVLRAWVEIRSSLTGYDSASFTAECVWRNEPRAKLRMIPSVWPEPLPVDPAKQLYGSLFFQGPMFQRAMALHDVSSRHCLMRIRLSPAGNGEEASDAAGLIGPVLGCAATRDAYLHSIQVCVPQYRILPIGIELLETTTTRGDYGYLIAHEREHTDQEYVYDVEVYGRSGELIERIRGYRCKVVGSFEDEPTLALLARLHDRAAFLAIA
jgi:enediyne polyketide synthase